MSLPSIAIIMKSLKIKVNKIANDTSFFKISKLITDGKIVVDIKRN